MDTQFLVNLGFSLAAGGIGWWCRQIWDRLNEVTKAIAALELKLVGDYVPNIEMAALKSEIVGALTRIEAKLDGEISRNR